MRTELLAASAYGAAAAGLGAASGFVFLLAWRHAFPAGIQSRFWAELSALGLRAITVDEVSEFLATYRRLFVVLVGYLTRNLAVAAVGGAAVLAALLFALVPLSDRWVASGGELRAISPGRDSLLTTQGSQATFERPGQVVRVAAGANPRIAACGSADNCRSLEWLGFEIVPREGATLGDSTVIIRKAKGDRNPLWPYLDDLEALFLLGLMLSPLALFALPKPTALAPPSSGFDLKAGDFALVQINAQFRPLIRALGNWESRRHRRQLDAIPLEKPVFVTGLARSGTTALLAALARSPEVGTHQYRDFPFLAAPLAWTRLQGAIGSEAAAVERPHKDRILITKASPDAFEEPLWREFFPDAHAVGVNQRLTGEARNPAFDRFFSVHLRKVLLLRGARRYVSKGNYNVGRIEYLARLFPDAAFIVPIRSPLAHIASLCRQHALFVRYADADPRVPVYLTAAGHFEFGAQRRPLSLSKGGALRQAGLASGDDVAGYAHQWAEVYGHVLGLMARTDLASRIRLVPYETFCADPAAGLADIVAFADLPDADGAIRAYAHEISASREEIPPEIEARADEIWAIVGEVATRAGYARPQPEPGSTT